jgi:predicted metal-dependent phosphoesterase TrpH
MDIADLHIHTTASDGLLTPSEVVKWAYYKKLKAIGITDHDNIGGISEAEQASLEYNIEVVPGVELNSQFKDEEIHILGYYIDYGSVILTDKLAQIKNSRYDRMIKMIEKLNSLGFNISKEDLDIVSEGTTVGRPHIARALLEKGYVSSLKVAFDKYLGKNKPAYVERYRLSIGEAIELIKKIGGVPILAHPGLIENKRYLSDILNMGIEGIEVYHTKHDHTTTKELLMMATERKLLITGGSDCHGMFVKDEPILGNVHIDYELVKKL